MVDQHYTTERAPTSLRSPHLQAASHLKTNTYSCSPVCSRWLCDRPAWLNGTAFLWSSVKAGHGLLSMGDSVCRNDVDSVCCSGQIAIITCSASCKICLRRLHFLCQTCLVERGRFLRATFIHILFQPGDTRLWRPITWNHFAYLPLSILALV